MLNKHMTSLLIAVTGFVALMSIAVVAAQDGGDQPSAESAATLSTAFTYQGRLMADGEAPVNDTCAFTFELYDVATGGSPLDALNTNTQVTDGFFTVQLDFGDAAFNGDDRYLDIGVDCGEGQIQFDERQTLSPAPYARYAARAPWSGITGIPADIADGDDDTTYSPGFGLNLSGTQFSVQSDTIQQRVDGSCGPGMAIRSIAADGTVTCETDDDTTYSPGFGLNLSGTQFSVQSDTIQQRVDGSCDPGQAIRSIAADGTVTCETDDGSSYSAGTGISLSNNTFSLNTAYTDNRYWRLGGNAGTDPATDYLGTSDAVTLTLAVDGIPVLRFSPPAGGFGNYTPNITAGSASNVITETLATGATIAGGGNNEFPNRINANYATISGGSGNVITETSATSATISGGHRNMATGSNSTIGGGAGNTVSATETTVSGGAYNSAEAPAATVGGGRNNFASEEYATTSGGSANVASAHFATVPGGRANVAAGLYSFAAGRRARAVNDGAFVWGDMTSANIYSGGDNQFVVRANGGIWLGRATAEFTPTIDSGVFISTSTGAHLTDGGAWTNASDRASKEAFEPVDGRDVLLRLVGMPIETWSYRAEDRAVRHMGPVAQEFYAAFGLGGNDTSISTVDVDGVALAAIQGLYEVVVEKEGRIATLEAEAIAQEERIDALQRQNDELEERVAAIERLIGEAAAKEQRDPGGLSLPDPGWIVAGLLFGLVVWRRRPEGGSL